MKKITLLYLFFFGMAQAQITYESADFSGVDESYILTNATGFTGLNFAQTGANFNWNYNTLQTGSQVAFSYQNPNTAGYKLIWCLTNFFVFNCNAQFNANFSHAQVQLDGLEFNGFALENVVEHSRLSSSTFENRMRGLTATFQGQSVPVAVDYDDPDELLNFPLIFGNSNVNTGHFLVELTDFNVPFSYDLTTQRTNTVEGWGALTTPFATFPNVLKLKTVLQQTELISIQGTQIPLNTTRIIYQWFDKAYGIPVLRAEGVQVFGNFIPTSVTYIDTPQCLEPTADFLSFGSPYNADTSSALVAFSSGGSNYDTATWDFGDGTTGSGLNVLHEYNCPGTYQVSLTVQNSICSPVTSAAVSLPVIVEDPQNLLTNTVTVTTSGLFAERSVAGTTYQWVDCNNGNTPIAGANEQLFVPLQSGSYACVLDTNGCVGVSDCVPFEVLGIEDGVWSKISIFPNPTSGRLSISPEPISYEVQIFNALGVMVSKTLDLTAHPNGVYIARITTDDGVVVRKIIKQ